MLSFGTRKHVAPQLFSG